MKRLLPIDCFHNNKQSPDGYAYYCKDCKKQSDKKYRETHIDALREYDRKRTPLRAKENPKKI